MRYYIKADSHSGLTKSLQSFYKPLMIERQCSLKTKQCNKKSCTHDFKPDVGITLCDYFIQDLCKSIAIQEAKLIG